MMYEIGRSIKHTSTRENQLPDEELSTGQNTQTFIQNQRSLELKPFFGDVWKFFSSAAYQMVSKFPSRGWAAYACCCGIAKRQSMKLLYPRLFISCFPSILPEEVTVDYVEDEFRVYQTTSFGGSILGKRNNEAWQDVGICRGETWKSSPTFQQSWLGY